MSIAMLSACLLIASATAQLSGKVVDESGNTVENAIVVISTARPRVGPATTCPSCYRDCAKRVKTNASGKFTIERLSDTLQFTLAAGAPGYQGVATEFYDPIENPEISLTLKPLTSSSNSARIAGTVVDHKGEPIGGAELRVRTIRRSNGRIGGSDETVTGLTLTDSKGEFEIAAGSHIQAFDVRAIATGFAPNEIHWSRSNSDPLRIQLGPGASLRGRLVYEGRPVPSVEVGLVQKNRVIGNIVTPQEVHTDASGIFQFEQLPPGLEYTLYTHTGQNAPAVLPVSVVDAPAHGQRAEFGDIKLKKPSRLTITVRTNDGARLPKNAYVMITRSDAWRGAKVVLGQQTSFTADFNDVPDETFGIIIRVPGYKVLRTKPATNLDMNRRYGISVSGETTVDFLMAPTNPSPNSVPDKRAI